MGKNRFKQRTRGFGKKSQQQQWQIEATQAIQGWNENENVNNNKNNIKRSVTQQLFDLRSSAKFKEKKQMIQEKVERKNNNSCEEYIVKEGREPLNNQELSLVMLSAKSVMLNFHVYKEYPEVFNVLPWDVKRILLDQAAVLSCNQPKRNRIIDDETLQLFIHEDIVHLNISCSLVSDKCIDVLLPKKTKMVTNEIVDKWEDLDDETIDIATSLEGLVNLKSLDVSFCVNITEDFVHRIGCDIAGLQKLRMASVFDDEGGLHAIAEFAKPKQFDALIELDLSHNQWLSLSMLLDHRIIDVETTTVLSSLRTLIIKDCDQINSQKGILLFKNPAFHCKTFGEWNKTKMEIEEFYLIHAIKAKNIQLFLHL